MNPVEDSDRVLGEVVRTGKDYFKATRHLRAALLTSSALGLAWALPSAPSRAAANGTWLTSPGSNDYGNGANWDGGFVPVGTASFGTSNTTSLAISSASVGGWTFNAGAANYVFDVSGQLNFTGAGITVNGGSVTINYNVSFSTSTFTGSSTAGDATLNVNSDLAFYGNSTAGNATINNNSQIEFFTTGPLTAGSIAGSGVFDLGGNQLTVGSNNLSTVVTGQIVDGSLVKIGTGTLTLSASNTFGGGVTLSAGTLGLANNNAVGTGALTIYGGTVAYADGIAIGNAIDLRGSATLDVTTGSATQAGAIGQTGGAFGIVKTGTGTLILSGANTYTGGTTVNGGLLQLGSAGGVGSIVGTVNVGANGRFSVVNADTSGITDISNAGLTVFQNANSAGSATISNSSTLYFSDTSTAGNASITNSSFGGLGFAGFATAGNASITNNGGISFVGNSTAGSATITNGSGGLLSLFDNATAGSATITNNYNMFFYANSTAGNATITNNASLNFNDHSTAGGATITNSATGNVYFNNSSSAGSATITSDNNYLYFNDTSTAGSANITNSVNSRAIFQGNATASNATITNGAYLYFYGSSTAGNAAITNNNWLSFNDTSTAGSATLTNNRWLYFYNDSTAGSAAITTSNLLVFRDNSTAGNASITNSNTINFVVSSTAGSATITNNAGGTTSFQDNSTAGNAQLINNAANAVFDFSGSTGPNGDHKLSAGSIAGNGTFSLGANELTVGSNNLSTAVSGVIADGGASGDTGGSLVKTGTGTLTLSGANTYTGGTTFAGGTVSVSSDANLGDLAGSLTFNGGALQVTGTAFTATTRTINWGAAGGTFDIANAANNFTVSQTLSGGALTKSGAGTLTLTGADTFSSVTVSAGTLVFLNNSAGSADIANNAQLTFYGNSTAGSATIHNSGNVLFDGNSTAGNAQLVNTTSSAVIDFNTPGPGSDGKISAGSIAGDGHFNLNGEELTVGGNNLSTTVTGVLTGDAHNTGTSLIKVGTGTLTLSGINTYTGATIVNGGTLAVNGSIASSSGVTVNSGGTLGGAGTVGNTTIASGGTLAPGNSVGTLTVSGSLTFSAGSFYRVEVSTAAVDRTNVSGTATLTGATVQAVAIPGSFRSQTYTILNATGGFGGTQFAGLSVSGSFSPTRNPHLTYDLNNVYLVLDPGTIALPAGTGANQSNVAGAINGAVASGGTPPAGFDALLNMGQPQLNGALGQVSGQPGAAGTQASFNAMQQFVGMLDPLGGGADGERGASAGDGGTLGYASTAPNDARVREAYAAVTPRDASGDVIDRRWGVWASAYGGASTLNGNAAAGSTTTSSRIYGTVVGADYRVSPNTLLGFALGGAGYNFTLSDSLGGGRADLFQAGVYGRHTFGPAYLSAALAYGWQDVTTDRTVTVSGTDKLTANFKASTFSGRLEAGWRFAPIPASTFGVTPYAAVQVTTFHLPGYGETAIVGSNQFALSYTAQDTTNVRTELGARTDQRFLVSDGVLTLRGRLAWAHDTNTNRLVSAAFQTLPGAAFTVNGAQPAADSALVGGRAEMKWKSGLSLAGTVEGEFSQSTQTYTGKGTVRYEW
ncbi:autotransporter-associated beta strand repeat-containing protein [Bradyrhizobium arachidis]|uniref:Autotransporter domain-containing protein n=1 Tax=Bradyrhizobium arachidis TaxID=858423 RepID=A0AAE7NM30_9BRAD|nr:autotransporter domain-containing protein [Bradyrhizobium arachidis]SFV02825.1 autotransporter-associated beta strand repeat-containing protein [Bradyrhizobium arachidis]